MIFATYIRTAIALLSSFLLLTIIGTRCHAFQPSSSTSNTIVPPSLFSSPSKSRSNSSIIRSKSQLQAHPELISGGHELATHAHAVHGYVQHHLLNSNNVGNSPFLLSDASASAASATSAGTNAIQQAETAVESFEQLAQEEGWWNAYLNIFKTTIDVVHNTIDGPIHKYTGWQGGTWGFSIAIFTAGVRSLLVPLSIQQSKSTEFNKALQPYVVKINARFKDNEERKNQAVGKLYEDSKQNPLSGCLLSIVQLPIILGLYRGVRLLALDGKLDESFLWIPSLEGPVTAAQDYRGLDWLTQGWQTIDGIPTPSLGWETTLAFCIMPAILVLGQKLTMQVLTPPDTTATSMDEDGNPQETDDSELSEKELEAKEQTDRTKVILQFLPLLIGFFSLQVPAALTIYWFTSNGFTLTQALLVRKYYEANPPEIKLPEYWDALSDDEEKMTAAQSRAAAKAGITKGPTLEDWIVNAQFHTVVDRTPGSLRETSPAWARIQSAYQSAVDIDTKSGNTEAMQLVVPTEFQAWVAASAAEESAEVNNHAGEINGDAAHADGTTAAVKEEAAKSVTTA
mmetsp:Transcript_47758/g.53210  ORF Transcript_47758/g.53210 Transcript_47758/m.53210 type:complete len:569 (+) Transcript_47758:225-1931(+)